MQTVRSFGLMSERPGLVPLYIAGSTGDPEIARNLFFHDEDNEIAEVHGNEAQTEENELREMDRIAAEIVGSG